MRRDEFYTAEETAGAFLMVAIVGIIVGAALASLVWWLWT